ncbi:nitrate/nitrite response regulator protein [Klebsiella pneumoniae]|nr:nitrate/nitrite response regulator protein [Klebsiella pneumoniae]
MSQQERATILLIDDHPMLRTGVKQLISMAPDIQVIGEASNGTQGIELAESLDPDLILLDLNMPGMNGLETLDKLREKSLSGRVVVFSVSNHEEDVVTALKRGADGYLLKDMEPEDLLKALQQAAAGEMVLSEALTPVLAASLRANRATSDRDISQLTPRERDILKLIAQGLPNKMIARRLDITESTVQSTREAHAEENEAQIPRGSGGMGPPGANLLRRVRPGDAWRGKLDQRLGQRQGDLIGGDALPLFILHHHRQAPAVRGARFTVPHRHNDAPAIGAAGIYRRRQAEGLGVSPASAAP